MEITERLKEYKSVFERSLSDWLARYPARYSPVWDAVNYALSAGGKRIRPALAYMGAGFAGGDISKAADVALCVEFIHTYSLIHDDLPCMDDDDLRRGRPTVHRVFSEGGAVLAGDALLNMAFECILSSGNSDCLRAGAYIANRSGMCGMVGGQCLDLNNTDTKGVDGSDELDKINLLKTSALFQAALAGGAIAAGCSDEERDVLIAYAGMCGKVFQIVDDILDVTSTKEVLGKEVGQDEKNGKITYVALLGLEGAKKRAIQLNDSCKALLASYKGRAEELLALSDYLLNRVK